jgi:uncharacterized membrane protein YbhN (UPF0104 family)
VVVWFQQPKIKRRSGAAFRWMCIVGTLAALWWYVRGLDYHELGATFSRTEIWPLVVAALLGLGSHSIRALGWTVMLGPGHHIPFGRQLRYEFTAQAASAVIPARAGELLRVWLLGRDGVPATTTAVLVAVKKLYECVGLAVLVAAAPWLLPGLPLWATNAIWIFAVLVIVATVVLAVVARLPAGTRPTSRWHKPVGGMAFMRDPRRLAAALGLAVIGEMADLAAVVAVLRSLQIDFPVIAAAVILFIVDTSNLFPSGPAHAGTFEVGVLAAFDALHGQAEAAVAFALVLHTQQVVSQVVVGLPFLLPQMLSRRAERRTAQPSLEHSGQ